MGKVPVWAVIAHRMAGESLDGPVVKDCYLRRLPEGEWDGPLTLAVSAITGVLNTAQGDECVVILNCDGLRYALRLAPPQERALASVRQFAEHVASQYAMGRN